MIRHVVLKMLSFVKLKSACDYLLSLIPVLSQSVTELTELPFLTQLDSQLFQLVCSLPSCTCIWKKKRERVHIYRQKSSCWMRFAFQPVDLFLCPGVLDWKHLSVRRYLRVNPSLLLDSLTLIMPSFKPLIQIEEHARLTCGLCISSWSYTQNLYCLSVFLRR